MNEVLAKDSSKNSDMARLTLADEQFAKVILDFLGKKEKLKLELKESFVLRHNDLEQFYYLIQEKVSREHNVSINHFSVSINYSDNTSRELSGIENLNSFLETRDVLPVDITLTWNIIVQYPNADSIENQRIELSFIKNKSKKEDGEVLLVINHTNQSWAIEILNLVRDKISEVSIKKLEVHNLALKISQLFPHDFLFSTLPRWLFIVLLLFITIFDIFSTQKFFDNKVYYQMLEITSDKSNSKEVEKALFAIQHLDTELLQHASEKLFTDKEIKSIVESVAEDRYYRYEVKNKSLIITISALILFFIFVLYLRHILNYHGRNSHLIINKRSEDEYNREMIQRSKIQYYSISVFAVSILCSVVANIVYSLIVIFF